MTRKATGGGKPDRAADGSDGKPQRKAGNIVVWAILGLLVLALAGFGVDGFGTAMRTVGKVGDREIDANEYANALQAEIQAASQRFGQGLTIDQAIALGLNRQVLQQIVQRAAFDNETDRIGLSVGDARVQQELLSLGAFRGLDGTFDREAYRVGLRNAGLTETRFEQQLREDVARTLFQGAVLGGIAAPSPYVDAIMTYLAERRNFTRLTLTRADLDAPLPEPTEADLRAHHAANPDAFTRPEAREITYAWLTPDMLMSTVEVDEALIADLYDSRAGQYSLPERRLVERLVFGSEDEAEAALARIDADGDGFDAIVAERGLSLSDVDMGDMSLEDLGAAGPEVFAAGAPAVVGPLPSRFGPAIYRVNAVLAPQVTPLDEVRDDLAAELAADRTRRLINDMVEQVDDLLAGGATLEEVAAETELELGQIAYDGSQREGIAAYASFRSAAGSVQEGDFPEAIVLDDGGVVALRLDGLRPEGVLPFEEVQVRVIESWAAAETERRLRDRAEDIVTALDAGQGFADQGLAAEAIEGVTRDGFVEGTTPALIEAVFDMEPGAHRIVADGGQVSIIRLDAVLPPDADDADVAALDAQLRDALAQGMAQDAFTYFSAALQDSAGISLNNAAIEAVHGLFQGGGAAPQHGGM